MYRDERIFKWVPNFYIILCGPPGVCAKSTTSQLGERLLRQVPGVDFGPSATTWQRLIQSMAATHRFTAVNGNWDEDWLLSTCVTMFVSELGSLLEPANQQQADVLTDLWDCRDRWSKETKLHGNDVLCNPWINFVACTTPAWLAENFPEKLIGGGFASRVVWVYGEKKRKLVAYPSQVVPPTEHAELEQKLVEDLILISELRGGYELTPEAIAWGSKWYDQHWEKRPPHLRSERYAGYIGRKQTHMHKLAIVLAASQRQELILTQKDLELSERLLLAMEPAMLNVFNSVGASPPARCAREIIVILSQTGGTTMRALITLMYERYDNKTVTEALRALQFTNRIRFEGVPTPDQMVLLNSDDAATEK